MHMVVRTPFKSYTSGQITNLTFDELLKIVENCVTVLSFETDSGRVVINSDVLKNSVIEIVK